MPRVSVVLPTYNRLDYLREAIQSVRSQTMPHWELIVVDDGSTDDTVAWMRMLDDPRIVFIEREHTGNRSVLRNLGIARGSAQWVAFLDSDDVWLPDKLSLQLARMEEHPDCRWSCTAISFVDGDGGVMPRHAGHEIPLSGRILGPLLRYETEATMPTLLVASSLLQEIHGFDEQLMLREDYDLEIRLAERSAIVSMPEPLTKVRLHSGRTSGLRRTADMHAGAARVFRKAARTLAEPRMRRLASHQAARQMADRARLLSHEGYDADALQALAAGVLDAPLNRDLWRAAAGCLSRVLRIRRRQI